MLYSHVEVAGLDAKTLPRPPKSVGDGDPVFGFFHRFDSHRDFVSSDTGPAALFCCARNIYVVVVLLGRPPHSLGRGGHVDVADAERCSAFNMASTPQEARRRTAFAGALYP